MGVGWSYDHSHRDQLVGILLIEDDLVTKPALDAYDGFSFGVDSLRDELEVLDYVSGWNTLLSKNSGRPAETRTRNNRFGDGYDAISPLAYGSR